VWKMKVEETVSLLEEVIRKVNWVRSKGMRISTLELENHKSKHAMQNHRVGKNGNKKHQGQTITNFKRNCKKKK